MTRWRGRLFIGILIGLLAIGVGSEPRADANCCNCVTCSTGGTGCADGADAPSDCSTVCANAGFSGCTLFQFTGDPNVCNAELGVCGTQTPTVSQTPTVTSTPSVTSTASQTSTPTASGTATATATSTETATATATATVTQTSTETATATATATDTATATSTATATATATPTVTNTPQADGASCTASGQCVSTFCVDGVCCNTACDQPLQSCNLPGAVGTCSGTTAEAPSLSRSGVGLSLLMLSGVAVWALARRRRS